MAEPKTIMPLDAEEIRTGISVFVGERTLDELGKNCDLYQCSYPRFKASIKIEGVLDKFGDLVPFKCEFEIPFTPPNVFRKQTGQSIPPTPEKADNSDELKSSFYQRPRGREYFSGREDD